MAEGQLNPVVSVPFVRKFIGLALLVKGFIGTGWSNKLAKEKSAKVAPHICVFPVKNLSRVLPFT